MLEAKGLADVSTGDENVSANQTKYFRKYLNNIIYT